MTPDPFEMRLPGMWRLRFQDAPDDFTGEGVYTFKLAGSFNAEVQNRYSGAVIWHGYWQIEDARLQLHAEEVTSWCSSCLGGGTTYEWSIELEQVGQDAFNGVLLTADEPTPRGVVFQRV